MKVLIGQKKGMLTVVRKTDQKAPDRSYIYECLCECNNTTYLPSSRIGKTNSCGCLIADTQRKRMETMRKKTNVNSTNIGFIKSTKIRKDNKSGVRGVCYIARRNQWKASICFQKRRYHLGYYNLNDKVSAIRARKEAESRLFDGFIEWYENNFSKNKDT